MLGDGVSDKRDGKQQKNTANGLIPNNPRRSNHFWNYMTREILGMAHSHEPQCFERVGELHHVHASKQVECDADSSVPFGFEESLRLHRCHATCSGSGDGLAVIAILHITGVKNARNVGARAAVRDDIAVRI